MTASVRYTLQQQNLFVKTTNTAIRAVPDANCNCNAAVPKPGA